MTILCPSCEAPLLLAPPADCSARAVHAAAASLPVITSCVDCRHMEDGYAWGTSACGLAGHAELPAEDVVPAWCPMRSRRTA